MPKRKKIGLALGAGGARGLAHIGVIKALEENNIKIDYIAGASMGAVIGACFALGMGAREMNEIAGKYKSKRNLLKFIDIAGPRTGVIKGKRVDSFFVDLFKDKKFKDTIIPLQVLATDLSSGKEVILRKGNIADAVRASVSVPGIFPPKVIGKQYLIDGGVVNPTPIDTVKKMGADIIIAVDFIMSKKVRLSNPSAIETMVRTFEIVRAQSVKSHLYHKGKDVIIITPSLRGTTESFRFTRIDEFIKSGEEATNKAIPKILKIIDKIDTRKS